MMKANGFTQEDSLFLRDPFRDPAEEEGPQKWNHVTLLKTQHMLVLANVKPALVEAFGTLYWESVTFQDQELFEWLNFQVRTSAAAGGRRADQMVEVMKAEQEARLNYARALNPNVTPMEAKR